MLSINTIARVAVNVARSASQPTSFDTGALLVKDSSYAAGGSDGLPAGGGKRNAPRQKGCGRVRAGGGDPAGVRGNSFLFSGLSHDTFLISKYASACRQIST